MTFQELLDRYAAGERYFRGADLRSADLRSADLRSADLRSADLEGANLQGANLQGVNLRYASLQNANMLGADLRSADLDGADLRGADLDGARLPEGYAHACVGWTGHGERGRTLRAVRDPSGDVMFSCGCFCGSEKELREYIAEGDEALQASRTRALKIVLEILEVTP